MPINHRLTKSTVLDDDFAGSHFVTNALGVLLAVPGLLGVAIAVHGVLQAEFSILLLPFLIVGVLLIAAAGLIAEAGTQRYGSGGSGRQAYSAWGALLALLLAGGCIAFTVYAYSRQLPTDGDGLIAAIEAAGHAANRLGWDEHRWGEGRAQLESFFAEHGEESREFAKRFGADEAYHVEIDGAEIVAISCPSTSVADEAAAKLRHGFAIGWWAFEGSGSQSDDTIKTVLGKYWVVR